MSNLKAVTIGECIDFNPSESLKNNKIAKNSIELNLWSGVN